MRVVINIIIFINNVWPRDVNHDESNIVTSVNQRKH